MKIFCLIKKDIMLIRKYVLIMFAAAILIPPFMLWKAPKYTGIFGFILSAVFCVLILLQYVSLKEYQFPKASTLLCTTPFSRKMMVMSKYIFCIAVYVVCCVIYTVETLLIPSLGAVNVTMFFVMLLVISVFIGIYLPIQYKIGYEKTKFVFTVIIMASPFILPQFMKMKSVNPNIFSVLSPPIICISSLSLSLIILLISAYLSVKFYIETDLA